MRVESFEREPRALHLPEFTTAWTLPPPWTDRSPSTAAWKPQSGSTSAHTDSYAIAAKISCAVGGSPGAASCFIDSTLK